MTRLLSDIPFLRDHLLSSMVDPALWLSSRSSLAMVGYPAHLQQADNGQNIYELILALTATTEGVIRSVEISQIPLSLDITLAMAELGAAASIVSIASATLQSVRFLCTTISNLKDVPDTIREIKSDLQSVGPILNNLHTTAQSDSTQIVLSAEVKSAVANCRRACTDFHSLLNRWMRYSTQDKTFWMDRWRVGLFGQERIRTFRSRVGDCKSTLTVALSTATM